MKADAKGHICPPSNAIHPSDRWESLFIYSFVCKFTNLRHKVEGLETPMDFENSLLDKEPNDILTQLLGQFILNLKPHTRNLSNDQISSTVASVLSEYFKSSERTIFWDDSLNANTDPFQGLEGGFFAAHWDFKLKILRQLVELQLSHSTEIKGIIDRAWGVTQNKNKKKDLVVAPPDTSDTKSQENLQLLPIGQDIQRKRYWVTDDSPRLYVSTNPWKTTSTFQSIASTREEYISVLENLKALSPPASKKGHRRPKPEHNHIALVNALEGRIEIIDAALVRVQRTRRKIEQKHALYAQAELRETRTRRRTQRPDYVYNNGDSEEDADEYLPREGSVDDEEVTDDDFMNYRTSALGARRKRRAASPTGHRRSARNAMRNTNGKREGSSDSWGPWSGERRSLRLGAPMDTDTNTDAILPRKRARTEESTASATSGDMISSATSAGPPDGLHIKTSGAAALRPSEIALEEFPGKKRSKFWVYAVEPVPAAVPVSSDTIVESPVSCAAQIETNGDEHTPDRNTEETRTGPPQNPDGSLAHLHYA